MTFGMCCIKCCIIYSFGHLNHRSSIAGNVLNRLIYCNGNGFGILFRIQNIFDLSSVAFAVLEVNGNLSVLLRSDEMPVTKKDIGKTAEDSTLPLPVISDGKIVKESLESLNMRENDLRRLLKGKKTKDIFLMTADRKENCVTVCKEKNK